MKNQLLDMLIAENTGFDSFEDLLKARGGYRPSINCVNNTDPKSKQKLTMLADYYDLAMQDRGDERRAYRF